jgi:hypothetical protein
MGRRYVQIKTTLTIAYSNRPEYIVTREEVDNGNSKLKENRHG